MKSDRNNFLAGLFVLVGFTAAFIAVLLLSDLERFLTPMQQVTVRFPLSDGVQGLKRGAEVTIGDAPAGQVQEIVDVYDPADDAVVIGKDVRFVIPQRYKLFDNAQIELVVPPLGSGTKLNIRSVGIAPAPDASMDEAGNPRLGDSWQYASGEVIRGGIAPSALTQSFVRDLGIEDLQRKQLQNIIANIDSLVAAIGNDPRPIAEIIENLRTITETLREDIPEITERTKSAVARADEALEKVNRILEDNEKRIESAIAGIDDATKTVQQMLKDNQQDIRDSIANVKSITETARNETIVKMNAALDKANEAVEDIRLSTKDLRDFVVTQKPVLEQTVANARLTTDQLKLAAIEVRRSPWRLMYKPTREELESDAIYDAARSFALAASSLEATSLSMQAMMERYGNTLNPNDTNLKKMLDNLHHSFEQFTEAEKHFWQALQQYRPK